RAPAAARRRAVGRDTGHAQLGRPHLSARVLGGYHIPRHFYLFDVSTLSRRLVEQGFEVVSVRSILSPAFWVYSVHNALADSPRLRRLARWFHAESPLPMAVAAAIDVVQIATRRQSTNLQLLARKR